MQKINLVGVYTSYIHTCIYIFHVFIFLPNSNPIKSQTPKKGRII